MHADGLWQRSADLSAYSAGYKATTAAFLYFYIFIEDIPSCLIFYKGNKLFIAAVKHNSSIYNFDQLLHNYIKHNNYEYAPTCFDI